jgi:hypothetical protein
MEERASLSAYRPVDLDGGVTNGGAINGAYGTLGLGSAINAPGARYAAVSWTDISGHLWLFGGNGYDSAGTNAALNDLWEYVP